MAIETRTIDYREGDTEFEGVLAWESDKADKRPGVIVAHTVRGRTTFEESKGRLLAEAGYVGFAIDVYGKETLGSELADCRSMMDALKADRELLQRRLASALATLREQPEVDPSRIAAIGFCFGGLCVLDIARTGADVAGVASFHGLFEPPGNTAGNSISAKILVLHGWDDPLALPEQAVGLTEELTAMGADWQMHAYGNVRHAFTNPEADPSAGITIYNADADRRSWLSMHNFLSELFAT